MQSQCEEEEKKQSEAVDTSPASEVIPGSSELVQQFSALDSDKDGFITVGEFLQNLASLKIGCDQAEDAAKIARLLQTEKNIDALCFTFLMRFCAQGDRFTLTEFLARFYKWYRALFGGHKESLPQKRAITEALKKSYNLSLFKVVLGEALPEEAYKSRLRVQFHLLGKDQSQYVKRAAQLQLLKEQKHLCQILFRVQDAASSVENEENFKEFSQLMKNLVIVLTSLSKPAKNLLSNFKITHHFIDSKYFALNLQISNASWLDFTTALFSLIVEYLSSGQKEEYASFSVLVREGLGELFKQSIWLGDLANLITSDLRLEFSMASNKLVQRILKEMQSLSKQENLSKKISDALVMFSLMSKMDATVQFDRLTIDDLQSTGLFDLLNYDIQPITLPYKIPIIKKITALFTKALRPYIRLQFANELVSAQIKAQTDLFSRLFQTVVAQQ